MLLDIEIIAGKADEFPKWVIAYLDPEIYK
jgi:hypothetical protein